MNRELADIIFSFNYVNMIRAYALAIENRQRLFQRFSVVEYFQFQSLLIFWHKKELS